MYVGRLLLALVVGLSAGLGYAAGQIESVESTERALAVEVERRAAAEDAARYEMKRRDDIQAEMRTMRQAGRAGICLEWLGPRVPVPEGQPILAGSKGLHTHHPDAQTWVVHDGDD